MVILLIGLKMSKKYTRNELSSLSFTHERFGTTFFPLRIFNVFLDVC